MTLVDLLGKNDGLRGAHAGRRCFIVGNGPSLAAQDLSRLKGEVCIVTGSFHRHPEASSIRPRYWVIADPEYWTRAEELFVPVFRKAVDLSIPTLLFLPTGGFPYFSGFRTGPLVDIHHFHYDPARGNEAPIDFASGIPEYANNVIMICLMLGYYLGCNPIYLIGCDHDWLKTTREEYERTVVEHFYAEKRPDAPATKMPWDQWTVAMRRADLQYRALNDYAVRWGFDVYNATRGGYLDYFPRIPYESLFPRDGNGGAPELPDAGADDPMRLGRAAIRLMEERDAPSARVLIERALRCNVNRPAKVLGLDYLMAVCLARMGRYPEAARYARQDHEGNPGNRERSSLLVAQLERM